MSRNERTPVADLLAAYLVGIIFLLVVFRTPDAGHANILLFFDAAEHTRWDHFGDWAAAWCSIKIILLTVGLFLMAHSVYRLLSLWSSLNLAWLSFVLPLIAAAGIWTGLYYLVKAVL